MMSIGPILVRLLDRYEPDNTPDRAAVIAADRTAQDHSIHAPADVDWAKFTLTERSNVILSTEGYRGDTEMWLFGPDAADAPIAYDNDSGPGAMSRIACVDDHALDPGTYYIKIAEHGADARILRYQLRVWATPVPLGDPYEPDDTPQQAGAIGVDAGPQTHSLHAGTDVDWLRFTLGAAADVVVETRGAAGDTQMWLFAAADTATPIAFDDDSGAGSFARIVCLGESALAAGDYYLKITEAGADEPIASYTISVTALQPGDVLLVQGTGGISAATRWGESRELGVPITATFSHAALYVGNSQVAEMIATGYALSPVADTFAHAELVDIHRHRDIGQFGNAVAQVARSYAGTPYAYTQYAVLGLAALNPGRPDRILSSVVYAAYRRLDLGTKRMICSELVARAFAEADASLALDVTLWPTMQAIGNTSEDFRMDFTTPTMLSLSPDLRRLNA